MENNLNFSAIELYSRKALNPFLEKYFKGDKVTGQEILLLSPIEQVNLFIIQQLFAKWHEENSKLKSPFFDYKNANVQEALKAFMAKLSQHILVSKEDLTPLVLQAISNAIFYVMAPVQYLEQKYFQSEKKYSAEELKNLFKYLKAHPKLAIYLKEHSDEWGDKKGSELITLVKTEFGNNYNDIVVENNLAHLLNGVLPVNPSDFHYAEPSKNKSNTLTDNFQPEQLTINDLVVKEQKETPLNLHTKNKVVDIRSAMSINQKIMFTKSLFNGDNAAFENAMSLADSSDSYEKAVNLIIDHYSIRFNWEIDSLEVNELFDLIGRKFYPENFAQSVGI